MNEPPLILTLRFDQASFDRFDRERSRHFPPDRNFIPAHLTLFHHLPGLLRETITDEIAARCSEQAGFPMLVAKLRSLGRGVAYVIESSELSGLHADLASRWTAHLTRQDAQGFRPHVTIQNKVSPDVARKTFEALSCSFEPFQAVATGLLLWHYKGGPWESADEFAFEG